MTNSPSAIPGAFNFQSAQRDSGSAPRISGVKSNLYQPPRTPVASASSSLILTRSTTSIISMNTSLGGTASRPATKKRTLNDYNDVQPPRMMDDWEKEHTQQAENWIPSSPKPFVNTRYQLAGGMDTPTLSVNAQEDERAYPEPGYRRSLSDMEESNGQVNNTWKDEGSSYFALDREANGRGRGYPAQRGNGWGKGAYSVVGAVVGKAIDFCMAGAGLFTGFRAGGGQAYKVSDMGSVSRFEAVENEQNWESEKQGNFFGERQGTPVPGRFPEDDFIPDYLDNPTPDDSPVRPSKRRQVSGGFRDEEIAKNWVVVPNPPARPTPPPAQTRALPRPTIRPNLVSRHSVTQTSRPASRAGFGPSRRSVAPRGSHAGSPALTPNRGASFAPLAAPRSPAHSSSRIPRASPMRESHSQRRPETPVDIETRQWASMRKREEKEADESIRRLDAQLKAMIREAKEALGTKVEVLDEDF